MLPALLFNTMEGSSNSLSDNGNASFANLYDENVILNSVRSRKKVSESASCPVCSCTIRHGELESHLNLELDRLYKLSNGGSKRKLSVNSGSASGSASGSNSTSGSTSASTSLNPVPGSSTEEIPDDQVVDVTGCPGGDVYQRVHSNRLQRLRARRRGSPPPAQGECPVCSVTLPTSRLQRHALRCLKRTGAAMDEDVPDTSSEEGSIDVENDSPGGFGAEYQWCGEWRVRASALQDAAARAAVCVRRASHDTALVVDGDEDTELYGPPQYSPSRIALDAVIAPVDREDRQTDDSEDPENDGVVADIHFNFTDPLPNKHNGMVEASAETRIQALKARIRDLEKKRNSASEAKCLICLGGYTSPTVSIQCWHVYCEVCWLESLRAKKICPQCNAITTAEHLRRIYM